MSRLSAIVPTLGSSRWLVPCLEALRREGAAIEIVLVVQRDSAAAEAAGRIRDAESLADRVLRFGPSLGFAAANNFGVAAASGDFLATVNDDAIVGEGWCSALLGALEADATLGAVQGINLRLDNQGMVDGAGLAWNRHWQAIQIGHADPVSSVPDESFEVFGVSATAAVYRRDALDGLEDAAAGPFDERLFAYYEDVDLAGRLRAAGWRARSVPVARARHAGSESSSALGGHRRLIYGNRHLVLARLLGRAFFPSLPRIVLRDLADLARAVSRGDSRLAAGIVTGLARALVYGPGFVRFGRPLVPLEDLRRFRTLAR